MEDFIKIIQADQESQKQGFRSAFEEPEENRIKRQLKVGDTVKCQNVSATIAEITFQEPWEWRKAWYLEFTDTNGVYRSWKQDVDGGSAFDEKGKEI